VALTAPARGAPYGIFAEDGGDAEDIPHSVTPIQSISNFGYVVRRKRRKRVGHPDSMRTWSKRDMMGVGQPFIGAFNGSDGDFEMIGRFERCRRAGCFGKRLVNKVANFEIQGFFFR